MGDPRKSIPALELMGIVAGGVCFIALLLFLVIPGMSRMTQVDAEISEARAEIERQKALQPSMLKLKAELQKLESASRLVTPAEPKAAIPGNISEATSALRSKAAQAGLTGASFIPASETVIGSKDTLRVDGALQGSLDSFRVFVQRIAALPWFDRIESVEITSGNGAPHIAVAIWVRTLGG